MTFHRIFASVVFLIAVTANAATAKASDISIFMGAALPGSVSYQDMKLPLDNSFVYGARYGYEFVPNFGMEHTVALSNDFLYSGSTGDCTCDDSCSCPPLWEKAKGFMYSSNLTLGFQFDKRTIPFLTAGVGLVHQYGDRDLPVGTQFAFNYGGGLKFPNIAGPIGGRIDMRGYRAGVFSNKVNIFEISFGLMISLDR